MGSHISYHIINIFVKRHRQSYTYPQTNIRNYSILAFSCKVCFTHRSFRQVTKVPSERVRDVMLWNATAAWRQHRSVNMFILYFIFSFFLLPFLFVPCGRLSCLSVSFLLHVKYTISYCIVYQRLCHEQRHRNLSRWSQVVSLKQHR